MCILAIGVDCHPDWPLVIAHNRDEEWDRCTDPPQAHDGVIYARDAFAGGTWMGLNGANGAFAALTNVRSSAPRPADGPSRGFGVEIAPDNVHLEEQRARLRATLSSSAMATRRKFGIQKVKREKK